MSDIMTAQVIGDKELAEAFRKAPQVVAKELGNAIDKSAHELQRRAVQYAPHNYGPLQQSITTQGPFVTTDNIFAKVGSNLKYAAAQEYGTRPFFPPLKPLQDWALRKFGDKNIGFLVARKISKEGIKPKRYMGRAKDETLPKMTDYMKDALTKIVHFLAKG